MDELIKMFKGYLVEFMNSCSRQEQRAFNEYLKKFRYIMIYPHNQRSGKCDNVDAENDMVFIAFTNTHRKIDNFTDADTWSETDNNDTNIFFLNCTKAVLLEEAIFISTETFEPIFMQPAPLSMVLDAPSVGNAHPEELSYAMTEFYQYDLPWEAEELFNKIIAETPDLECYYTFYEKCKENNRRPKCQSTAVVKYKDEILGFISCNNYEDSKNISVLNPEKWDSLMSMLIENSGIYKLVERRYNVIDTTVDCDIYFPVPGITKYKFGEDE